MRTPATLVLFLTLLASGCAATNEAREEETDPRCRQYERAKAEVRGSVPALPTLQKAASGIWISREELLRLPTSGGAWERMKDTADGDLEDPDVADKDSNHDVQTLAVALVYARTGEASYRAQAAEAIASAVGTEEGGTTLALGRNLLSYVIAADLIDFRGYDPEGEAEFRDWLRTVRHAPLGSEAVEDQTLIGTHERSPSNWGGMAGASRVAVAVYVGDEQDLARAATLMKGWVGDRSAYPGIPSPCFGAGDAGKGHRFGGADDDLSWHADPARPRGVNPTGARKQGHSIDGALPDDMRRGGSFMWPPRYTQYPREALSGYVALAELLFRQGYDVYEWEDRALLRAASFLLDLEREFPDEDWWEPKVPAYWILNSRYGTSLPVEDSGGGRNVGWTDWTHAVP
jgi:Alginate lyase